jgi:hypothetical protein
MASETDIANLALQHLGIDPIITIEETANKVSRTCKVNFDQARDEALMTAMWSSAKKQETLTKLTEVPVFNWSAYYQLPADFLRLIEIDGESAWMAEEYFEQHGKKLAVGRGSDSGPETVSILYIRQETNPTLFEPLLVETIAMLLAIKCARTLTGSDNKAQSLREEYERIVLPRAMTVNAAQLYTGHNHPIRKFLNRSFLGRSRSGASLLDDSSRINIPESSVGVPSEPAPNLDAIAEEGLP